MEEDWENTNLILKEILTSKKNIFAASTLHLMRTRITSTINPQHDMIICFRYLMTAVFEQICWKRYTWEIGLKKLSRLLQQI